VLLYFWLLGHWFARVLVFLGLIPVLGLLLFALIGACARWRSDRPRPADGLLDDGGR
jgi:hypothetical protein